MIKDHKAAQDSRKIDANRGQSNGGAHAVDALRAPLLQTLNRLVRLQLSSDPDAALELVSRAENVARRDQLQYLRELATCLHEHGYTEQAAGIVRRSLDLLKSETSSESQELRLELHADLIEYAAATEP